MSREEKHVIWSDRWQQWLVLDRHGEIVDMKSSRYEARERRKAFNAQEQWSMGVLGLMAQVARNIGAVWTQQAIAEAYGVSTRTVRDCMRYVQERRITEGLVGSRGTG